MIKGTIFVMLFKDGDIVAANKQEIEYEIKNCEERGGELDFKTIAELKQPPQGISPDFDTRLIEFFDKEEDTTELRNKAALAIINRLI
jgi:predicted phage-related endonuclease